jgi:UDPglucose 6-dehydrogenase
MNIAVKKPIIFDGRNQYNAFFFIEQQGFEYYQIGK